MGVADFLGMDVPCSRCVVEMFLKTLSSIASNGAGLQGVFVTGVDVRLKKGYERPF
jgi:hypothetical protein